MSVRRLFALALLVLASPAVAQNGAHPLIEPGDARLDGSAIRPGSWIFHMNMVREGQEDRTADVYYEVTRVKVAGQAAFRVVQSLDTPAGPVADTAVMLASTLAPVTHRSHSPQRLLDLEFDGSHVTGALKPASGEKTAIDHDLGVVAFDANVLDVLYGALPLADGFAATLPAYVHEAGGRIDVSLRVIRRTTVMSENRPRPAWELAVEFPMGKGRFWVDVETREPLRAEMTANDGSTTKVVR